MLTIEMKTKVMPILKKAEIDVAVAIGRDLKIVALDRSGQIINLEVELPSKVTVEQEQAIRKAIAEVFDEDWKRITSKSRKRELVMARQLYCWYARFWANMSYTIIGKIVGGRDHTTAIHACQAVKDLLDTKNEAMAGRFIQVQEKLNSFLYES